MTDLACTRCKFYDDHHVNGAQTNDEAGLCRFNPPVSQPEPEGRGLWPVVSANDWCGHFTAEGMGVAAE